jgi:hypothetical protein
MILVFGILSIVVCFIFGIVSWIMGNSDLAAIRSGEMDPSGEGLVKAGKICGIVGIILQLGGILIYILLVVLVLGGMAAAAGAGAAGGGP